MNTVKKHCGKNSTESVRQNDRNTRSHLEGQGILPLSYFAGTLTHCSLLLHSLFLIGFLSYPASEYYSSLGEL